VFRFHSQLFIDGRRCLPKKMMPAEEIKNGWKVVVFGWFVLNCVEAMEQKLK
jgi:hypothetical protein